MITEEILDKSLKAIVNHDYREVSILASNVYGINVDNLGKEEYIIKKFEELLMKDIESSRELTISFRKLAVRGGKYDAGLWDFIINNTNDSKSLKVYIQNYWKYCKDEEELKSNEEILVEKIKMTGDIQFIIYCINNCIISDNRIEDMVREMEDMGLIDWLIMHRDEYEKQISLNALISIASSKVGIKYYLDNFEKYKFTPKEISIIAMFQNEKGISEYVIGNREKYKFSEIDTIRYIDMACSMDIKKYLENIEKYKFNNYEISCLVSLTKDKKFIRQWIKHNKDKHNFNEEEMFIMILSSGDQEVLEWYMEKCGKEQLNHIKINVPKDMSVGIEIESEGKNSYVIMKLQELIKDWLTKEDVSLNNGVEVVSPKLGENKDEEKLYEVCEILKCAGQEVNQNCGGHIHIGADYLTCVQSYKNLIDLWTNTEKIMYLISNEEGKLPRRGIELYAPTISNVIEDGVTKGDIDLYDEEDLESFSKKLFQIQFFGKQSSEIMTKDNYYSINFKNINKTCKKTIEFRLANGTINPETIIKNINLFGGIVRISEELVYIRSLKENDRTEKQKEKLKIFDFIINSNSNNELLKAKALLYLTVEDDMKYYLKRYKVNSRLFEEIGEEDKQILDKASEKGMRLSNKYSEISEQEINSPDRFDEVYTILEREM